MRYYLGVFVLSVLANLMVAQEVPLNQRECLSRYVGTWYQQLDTASR